MKDIVGNDVPLRGFEGRVLLVVNVASKCGLTPQYKGLQELYEKYRDKGFEVLGFPANNFMWQEPGTDAQIQEFCSTNYSVTFPIFSKISVKGKDIHPLYEFLTSPATNPEVLRKDRLELRQVPRRQEGQRDRAFRAEEGTDVTGGRRGSRGCAGPVIGA